MRSLSVVYNKQFTRVSEKPESYRELADNLEWAKREVDQDVEGHYYDGCNDYLDSILAQQRGKTVVECSCVHGRNLDRYAADNRCIGLDFNSSGLQKIRQRGTGVEPVNADIRYVPLADASGSSYSTITARPNRSDC